MRPEHKQNLEKKSRNAFMAPPTGSLVMAMPEILKIKSLGPREMRNSQVGSNSIQQDVT